MPTHYPSIQAALERAIDLGEIGLQVAAYLGEELIIDQWAGVTDRDGGQPVDGDTLFAVFSVTKGVTAAAIHIQAERGLLDPDAPIARYWPEFAANGKQDITIRHVLSHRSGLPQMPVGVTPERMADWNWMIRGFEQLAPIFPPGTANAYHALGWGWLLAEVVVRTDPRHRPFGEFVQQEICQPLGITDLYMGLPRHLHGRVATLANGGRQRPDVHDAMPDPVYPWSQVHNLSVVRESCHPGAGVICNARSMARFYAMLANGGALGGVRLISEARLRHSLQPREQPFDTDQVIGGTPWLGVGGFWLGGESPPANAIADKNPNTLVNPGAGGSVGWANLDDRLAVSLTHNNMSAGPDGFIGVAEAVRAVVRERLGAVSA